MTKFYAKAPTGTVGLWEETFIFPLSHADDMITQATGDIRVLEQLPGFDPGGLGDAPVRIDALKPHGLRMPTGNERGANPYWIPGGYTSGGIPEAVIDQVQPDDYTVIPVQ